MAVSDQGMGLCFMLMQNFLCGTYLCYGLLCCCGSVMLNLGLAKHMLPAHPEHHFCHPLQSAALGSCLYCLYSYTSPVCTRAYTGNPRLRRILQGKPNQNKPFPGLKEAHRCYVYLLKKLTRNMWRSSKESYFQAMRTLSQAHRQSV